MFILGKHPGSTCQLLTERKLSNSAAQLQPNHHLGPFSVSSSAGRGRSRITGLTGISGLGPNSEPCGNNRSFPETRERARVPVKKIGSPGGGWSYIFPTLNSIPFFPDKCRYHRIFTLSGLFRTCQAPDSAAEVDPIAHFGHFRSHLATCTW